MTMTARIAGPLRVATTLCGLIAALSVLPANAQRPSEPAAAGERKPSLPDGPGGFDFEIGRWNSVVKRLKRPLSGSHEWVELSGTTVVRKLLDGRANIAELDIAGPSGRIQGVSLRLYDAQSRQWSIHYANIAAGALTAPMLGDFRHGRGEFHGDDTLDGRPIKVRFVIECDRRESCRFEQAFSADAGKTWELNWLATDILIEAPDPSPR
ncbi:hypothetical protein AZ78_0037 [Lysobacter capsici AZ78]|uniref:DUF1579 domain-containing protein n=1 Tax=Lysobacter capsici AZ78 TaxID=1444315 RepID=A0A125U089_9GAMM|nr:hypothetical protein [Lysobacter capsici]KWS02493.1 hypothetical protein AZ78_0037 [Lysobacter capsici AZ78]